MHAYYAANQAQFQKPATRAVQEILVGKNKQALASQIYSQVQGGADFAALAKKYSQDPGSKDKGGNYTATKGSDVPEFDAAVFDPKAKTGVLIKPVEDGAVRLVRDQARRGDQARLDDTREKAVAPRSASSSSSRSSSSWRATGCRRSPRTTAQGKISLRRPATRRRRIPARRSRRRTRPRPS